MTNVKEIEHEILIWEGLLIGVICAGIYAQLLHKRSKLAFLVNLQILFVTCYLALTFLFFTKLIVFYIDPLFNDHWFVIFEEMMWFVINLCYLTAHWTFSWKYWLVS